MSDELIFIDSNVWLYSLFISPDDDDKQRQAAEIIDPCEPLISYQVIQEVLANVIRKLKPSQQKLHEILQGLLEDCTIIPITTELIQQALTLMDRYQVSFWDSLIISTALAGRATILYSEDMHDGLVIENQLTIKNPF